MTGRERVVATIERKPVDRIPIYGWVRKNLEDELTKAFGSVEAFEDHYELDYAHIFGGHRGPTTATRFVSCRCRNDGRSQ